MRAASFVLAASMLTSRAGAAPPASEEASPLTGEGLAVRLAGPAVPYESVLYQLGREGGAVAISVTKTFAAGFGQRSELGLLPDGALAAQLASWRAAGWLAAGDAKGAEPRARAEVWWADGSAQGHFVVDDPDVADDPRARGLLADLRALLSAHTTPIIYRDPMLLPTEGGRLRLKSRPAAHAVIDGVPQEGKTPMSDILLAAGMHVVELRDDATGLTRRYEVTIEVGKTTSLDVALD